MNILIDASIVQFTQEADIINYWAAVISRLPKVMTSDKFFVLWRSSSLGPMFEKDDNVTFITVPAADYESNACENERLSIIAKELAIDVFIGSFYTAPSSSIPSILFIYDTQPELYPTKFRGDDPVLVAKRASVALARRFTVFCRSVAEDLSALYDIRAGRISVNTWPMNAAPTDDVEMAWSTHIQKLETDLLLAAGKPPTREESDVAREVDTAYRVQLQYYHARDIVRLSIEMLAAGNYADALHGFTTVDSLLIGVDPKFFDRSHPLNNPSKCRIPELHYVKALAFSMAGRVREAELEARAQLLESPDHVGALTLLDTIQQGKAKSPTGENNSAITSGELDNIIAPEIKDDEFYHLIMKLAREEHVETVLEIGSSAGGGSTEAFVTGLQQNIGQPRLFCMEVSQVRFEGLSGTYADKAFVRCYNTSSVDLAKFATSSEVERFYRSFHTNLNQFPLQQVLGWLQQDLEYVQDSGRNEDGISRIRRENGIDQFDMVLIDGSEFTGKAELDQVYGAHWLLLDDVNAFKNYENYKRLIKDPSYELYRENLKLRNGYAVFKKKESELPIHFFTIVLNGMPFIKYHIDVLRQLSFNWHWHIVEGVADLVNDTAWSKQLGGHIAERDHSNALSIDGTTDYLDQLKHQYPDNISIYRKPGGCFWEGKLEMVNAPISSIREKCLLWQIDVDEYWTSEQIKMTRSIFVQHPEKTAAFYWCDFFVGKNLVVNSRNCYSQNPAQEWLRTWRYHPGCRWVAHEPPRLYRPLSNGSSVDLANENPFTHAETERQGLVFQHFAYVLPKQLQFKESYYGYKGALSCWLKLQDQKDFPVYLRDYFPWVGDVTTVDTADNQGISPLTLPHDNQSAIPLVIIDGIFFQLMNTGIARLWSALLTEWSKTDFAPSILLLDRAGTAPKITGIRTRIISAYDYNATDKDRSMLQTICDEESADIFVSTYYTTPLTTPSVFYAYDMIPENTPFFDLNNSPWREKHYGITHATAYLAISRNTAMDLAKAYPPAKSKITVAYPAVDRAVFSPASVHEIERFRRKYNLSNPYLLYVGSRQFYKNAKLLFEGFAHLNDTNLLEIVCVGGLPSLETQFSQIVPNCAVHMLQLTDDELRLAYSAAVALVYPSVYEGFGLPILEAMACNCPVITCQNSSILEVAGAAALYVEVDSPDEMAANIQHIQQPEIRNHLIKIGRRQAQKFSWSKMADEVREALVTTYKAIERT